MKVSRRSMLRNGAVIAGVTAFPWLARPVAAQAKATKQAMQYQDQPKNGQRCDTCMQFIPGAKADGPGTCKVVEGSISPSGYCIAYVKKS